MKQFAGTWQRFAPPPSAADIRKIQNKDARSKARYGQPYLRRKSGEPTFHQEILDVLQGKETCELNKDFKDALRFGPSSQVLKKIEMISRRGDATGEWALLRNGNLVRLVPSP
jgi:hypothetical protein